MKAPRPDRLGDSIRTLARTMAEHGKRSLQLHVVTPGTRAVYEIRLLRTYDRAKPIGTARLRRLSDHLIETEAYGPEHAECPRQMAANEKE